MNRGDIYLVSLDPTEGHEQQGRRPVLIVSPAAFNRITKTPIVLPITTGGAFARNAGFAVSLIGTGLKTTGIIRCDQPRALDLTARGARKIETVPATVMDEVLARIAPIFE
jgi:mRNA interferase ChpB